MAIRKIGAKKLAASLLALSLMTTLASFPAYADGIDAENDGTGSLVDMPDQDYIPPSDLPAYYDIVLDFTDAYATGILEEVCYPGRPYLYDAEVTLTVDGVTHKGIQVSSTEMYNSRRVYNFPDLTSIPETATLAITTDAETFINLEDSELYQYKLSKNIAKDIPDTTSITLTKDDWHLADVETNTYAAKAYATADDYGLCSVLILEGLYDIVTPAWAFENRADYVPNIITDVIASVSGNKTSHGQPINGVVHFRVPTKWDDVANEYTKRANVTLDIIGVNTVAASMPYTAQVSIEVGDFGTNAYSKFYRLEDCNFSPIGADDDSDDEPKDDSDEDVDIPLDDDIGDVVDTGSYLNITVDSALDKYKLDLIYTNLAVELKGKVTQEYIDMFGRGKLGEIISWANVAIEKSNTDKYQVSAGDYTLEGSNLLDLEYKGKLTVKEQGTSDVTLKVSPKYTLELTSKAGTIDCTIAGAKFDGETKINFMLEGNKTYYIVDNDTQYAYEIKATDENPHVKLTLGSTTGAIIPDDNNNKPDDFEDVPNTSDNISIMGIICGSCIVLFAGSFFFVYRLNKKEERRKR